eukprot:PhF_6_TR9176/c0_g1_i2/m.14296
MYVSFGVASCQPMLPPNAMNFIRDVFRELHGRCDEANEADILGTWACGPPGEHTLGRYGSVPILEGRHVAQLIGVPPFTRTPPKMCHTTLTTLLVLKGIVFIREEGDEETQGMEDNWIHNLRSVNPIVEVRLSQNSPSNVAQWIIATITAQPKFAPPPNVVEDEIDPFFIRIVSHRIGRAIGYVVSGTHDLSGSKDQQLCTFPFDGIRSPTRIWSGKTRLDSKDSSVLHPGQCVSVCWDWKAHPTPRIPLLMHKASYGNFHASHWIVVTAQREVGGKPGDMVFVTTDVSHGRLTIHCVTSNTSFIAYSTTPVVCRFETPEKGILATSTQIHRCEVSVCPLPIPANTMTRKSKDLMLRVVFMTAHLQHSSEAHQLRNHVIHQSHRFDVVTVDNPQALRQLVDEDVRRTCVVLYYNGTSDSLSNIDEVMSWAHPQQGSHHLSFIFMVDDNPNQRVQTEIKLLQKISELQVNGIRFIRPEDVDSSMMSEFVHMVSANNWGMKAHYNGWVPMYNRPPAIHALLRPDALVMISVEKHLRAPRMFLGYQLRCLSAKEESTPPRGLVVWSSSSPPNLVSRLGLDVATEDNDTANSIFGIYATNPAMIMAMIVLLTGEGDFTNLMIPQDFHGVSSSVLLTICQYALHTPVIPGTVIQGPCRHVINSKRTICTTFPNRSNIAKYSRLPFSVIHDDLSVVMRTPSIPINPQERSAWLINDGHQHDFVYHKEKLEVEFTWTGYDRDISRQPLRALYLDDFAGVYIFDVPSSVPLTSYRPDHVNNLQAMLAHLHLPAWNFSAFNVPSGITLLFSNKETKKIMRYCVDHANIKMYVRTNFKRYYFRPVHPHHDEDEDLKVYEGNYGTGVTMNGTQSAVIAENGVDWIRSSVWKHLDRMHVAQCKHIHELVIEIGGVVRTFVSHNTPFWVERPPTG